METYLPPNRQLLLQTKAILANSHLTNDNFGGWVVAQMHLAGRIVASKKANGDVEDGAINDLVFHQSILSDDEISCYAEVIHMNKTSLTLQIEAWSRHSLTEESIKAIEGTFTYLVIKVSDPISYGSAK